MRLRHSAAGVPRIGGRFVASNKGAINHIWMKIKVSIGRTYCDPAENDRGDHYSGVFEEVHFINDDEVGKYLRETNKPEQITPGLKHFWVFVGVSLSCFMLHELMHVVSSVRNIRTISFSHITNKWQARLRLSSAF